MRKREVILARALKAFSTLIGLIPALGAHSPAQHQSIRFELDTVRSRIGFYAQATAGPFEGTAERYRGYVEVADTVQFAGANGRVEVDVGSFRTGIGMRDGHLRSAMEADEHPTLVYEVTRIHRLDGPLPAEAGLSIPEGEPEREAVVLYGRLTVRGVTHEVGSYALVRFAADSVYALGRVPIHFTDFDMEPPKRLLGLTKVDDRLVLFFDAVFAAAAPPPAENRAGAEQTTSGP